MYDLKIVGGTLVDGSGGDRYSGDVGIKDGRIVDVGKCDGSATETIDADGAIVAPGFVDIHTHYDGQITHGPRQAHRAHGGRRRHPGHGAVRRD
ncbi:MAG: hypothetical protein JRF48_14140 [Deltaproteobacteria bacterium]|nr:hypothetical protein [Deltaproteobacteria bacterium]